MARTKDPAIRTLLIERAGHMLRTREPITLRSLVADTGVSTMAVYTYFGGMDGLWKALRQEGFTRLDTRLAAITLTDDPVRDLAALAAGYVANALENPDLYRVMFDASFDLENAEAADSTLNRLVTAATRAVSLGRLDADPLDTAIRTWAVGHGVVSLVATGPLPPEALTHCVPLLTAVLIAAGDTPEACRESVQAGWF